MSSSSSDGRPLLGENPQLEEQILELTHARLLLTGPETGTLSSLSVVVASPRSSQQPASHGMMPSGSIKNKCRVGCIPGWAAALKGGHHPRQHQIGRSRVGHYCRCRRRFEHRRGHQKGEVRGKQRPDSIMSGACLRTLVPSPLCPPRSTGRVNSYFSPRSLLTPAAKTTKTKTCLCWCGGNNAALSGAKRDTEEEVVESVCAQGVVGGWRWHATATTITTTTYIMRSYREAKRIPKNLHIFVLMCNFSPLVYCFALTHDCMECFLFLC